MQHGKLAQQVCGMELPLQVLGSQAGYYIGTTDECGPYSRESVEYFPTKEAAFAALETGEWTQKTTP
jgi:hypothetical protein